MAKSKKKAKRTNKSGDNFILLHGEKFIFAIIFLAAIWMISRGNGLEKFTLTPDQIKDAASKADDRIKKNKIELKDVDEELTVYDYSGYSRLIRSALKPGMYPTPIRWEQSLFPAKNKRSDVTALPLEKLQAEAGIGAIKYLPEENRTGQTPAGGGMSPGMMGRPASGAGGGTDQGREWVVVTGLIPVGKEFREYDEKFANAEYTDINRDIPRYVFYDIERGTLGEDGQIAWEKIELEKVYEEEVDRWSGFGIDPVSAIHAVPIFSPSLPALTMPCPPISNKSYGEEVAHLPEIPLLSDEQLEEQSFLLKEQKELNEELLKSNKRDFDFSRAQAAGDPQAPGRPGQLPGGMGGGMGSMPGAGGGRPNPATGAMSPRNMVAVSKNMEEDYYLFRHFDFDVEPGKTYYYRVKLFLSNPNYGLDVNLVENSATVSQSTIETDFCEPSNPVALGMDSRILVETVEPAPRLWSEPKVTVASIYFDQKNVQESLTTGKKLARGQVANFLREARKPVNMTGAGVSAAPAADGPSRKNNARTTDDHISNICLLDSLGGYNVKIGGRGSTQTLVGPAKILVLEPSGLVKIRELDTDQRERKRYEQPGGQRR